MSAVMSPLATATDVFTRARANYPAAREWTYLNVGSRGIVSDATRAATIGVVDGHWTVDISKESLAPMLDACRNGFAHLIGGAASEVAIATSVSDGLNAIANAVSWRSGDNVVMSADYEHANNVYLWYHLRRHGVEVRAIPPRGHEIDAEGLAAAIDARTRVVTASSVTFTPGFRTNLAPIGQAARAKGALFLVDGVQSCGVLQLDVNEACVDALVTSTSKGLLGLMGAGLLWVRKEWLPKLTPTYVARTSIATSGHYSEIESVDFAFAPTAERFEVGNPNWLGVAAAAQSIAEINAIGVAEIERHAIALAEELRVGLEGLGLPVLRPLTKSALSHLVTVGTRGSGDAYATQDQTLNTIAKALTDARVRYSIRRGLLRFGFHLYNDRSDVEAAVAIARRALGR